MQMETTNNASKVGNWVLFATISASSMAFIDGTALNVALPAIQLDLKASGADLLWIVNAYALILAALLLVGGSLGDHYGRKRIYMLGILMFSTMSFICGISPSTQVLIAARALQGIGGALMIPGSLAIVSAYFDDSQRGKAIGTWSSFTTLTALLGPVIGGFLAENGLWRGIFFINIPLALAASYALVRYVPESRDEEGARALDIPGAVLATIGLSGLTFCFIEGGNRGFDNPLVLTSIIIGIIAMTVFIYVEARSDHPMMPLRLFRSRSFSGANLLTLLLYGGLGGALLFFPLNLVQVQGYRESVAGLTLLPQSILLALMSRWAGGLVDRYGPRIPLIIGPLIASVGFGLLSTVGITAGESDYWTSFFPGLVAFGIGMGITVAPLVTTVMGSVPQHYAGIASGINNAVSRSAIALISAIMGGLGLILFSQVLMASPIVSSLDGDVQRQLSQNAVDLGNTLVPEGLSDTMQTQIKEAIQQAFVEMFRTIMLVATGLALASALFAGLLVENRLHMLEDPLPAPAQASNPEQST